jgi:hypothetical protein
MAILSAENKARLARLTALKAQYDLDEERLQEAILSTRAKNKEPIREAVQECIKNGIPGRQIHINGLGLGQYSQMQAFLAERTVGTRNEELLGMLANGGNKPLLGGVERKIVKVAVSQFGQGANFTDASGKRAEVSRRNYWKTGMYLISQMVWDNLTEEYKTIMLEDEAFTLIGDDEIEAFENDGIAPDRWVGYVPPTN